MTRQAGSAELRSARTLNRRRSIRTWALIVVVLAIIASGCQRDDMWNQPRGESLGASTFFEDGSMARTPPEGTVARGRLMDDELLHTGRVNGAPAQVFPFEITRETMERGMDRYNIFCAPCHAKTGDGLGMIVQRGFGKPPSLLDEELKNAPIGRLYDVFNQDRPYEPPATGSGFVGEGDMVHPVLGKNIPPEDRWSIVAYIRALQRSQSATINDVPPAEREALAEAINRVGPAGGPAPAPQGGGH